jgi:hypothetical protein
MEGWNSCNLLRNSFLVAQKLFSVNNIGARNSHIAIKFDSILHSEETKKVFT